MPSLWIWDCVMKNRALGGFSSLPFLCQATRFQVPWMSGVFIFGLDPSAKIRGEAADHGAGEAREDD
jgi:hypothetical protein